MTISFVNSAVSDTHEIIIPSDAAIGDLAVYLNFAVDGDTSAPTDVVPTDWTGLIEVENDGIVQASRGRASYKILVSGDPGSTITGMNGNQQDSNVMFVFRSSTGIFSVTPSTWQGSRSTGNPSAISLTASAGGVPSVVIAYCATDNTTAEFSTASPSFTAEVESANGGINAGYIIYSSSPQNHTVDMNDLDNRNTLVGGYIVIVENQVLTPSLVTNTQTFFAPTVTTTYGLTPSLFTNTNTFYSATIVAAQTVAPSLVTNTQTFYEPTITTGEVTLTPSLVTNTQTFYGPTVTVGEVTLTPNLVTNTQTFFAPTVSTTYSLTPSLVTNTTTFYAPTVAVGAVDLTPSLVTNTQTFFSPVISVGGVTLTPNLFTNTTTFYAPTISVGGVTLSPSLVVNTNTFYSPTVDGGTATLLPELFINTQTFFAATVALEVESSGGYLEKRRRRLSRKRN